jgi:hypothetical protein
LRADKASFKCEQYTNMVLLSAWRDYLTENPLALFSNQEKLDILGRTSIGTLDQELVPLLALIISRMNPLNRQSLYKFIGFLKR